MTGAEELHFKASALIKKGDLQEARNLLALALTADPQNVRYILDYAQVYADLGQYVKAENFFSAALQLEPESALGNFRWANLCKQFGQVIKAVDIYSRAIAANPEYVEAFNNRGAAYDIMGKYSEARADYLRACELNPQLEEAYLNLGRLQDTTGDFAAAADTYRRALEHGLNSDLFSHLLLSVTGATSAKAPLGYVRTIFNDYANAFDLHLTQTLGYTLPALIGTQVRAIAAQRKDRLIAVDLGCGTGLCGAEIAACTTHLVGVDASPGMLDHADRRGIYHDLVEGDIERYLCGLGNASADVLMAADVFIYIGSLRDIFFEAARTLRQHGTFIFSIESNDGEMDYQLQRTGRYVHSPDYISRMAVAAGLTAYRAEAINLRLERGLPVRGKLFTFRKPQVHAVVSIAP